MTGGPESRKTRRKYPLWVADGAKSRAGRLKPTGGQELKERPCGVCGKAGLDTRRCLSVLHLKMPATVRMTSRMQYSTPAHIIPLNPQIKPQYRSWFGGGLPLGSTQPGCGTHGTTTKQFQTTTPSHTLPASRVNAHLKTLLLLLPEDYRRTSSSPHDTRR